MLNSIAHPVTAHYCETEAINQLHSAFAQHRYVRIPNLLNAELIAVLRHELSALEKLKASRDFLMPGHNTPRRMSTIGGSIIRKYSSILVSLYENHHLRSFVSALSGHTVYPCTHPSEFMVANFLENLGDTHGWHLDDPALALIIVLEAPPAIAGGLLEYISGWPTYCLNAEVSKDSDPSVLVRQLRTSGRIQTVHHESGDAYLLRANECLHRVTPLRWLIQRRVVLNLAYEIAPMPQYGATATLLYD